jgi:hypothetical protein
VHLGYEKRRRRGCTNIEEKRSSGRGYLIFNLAANHSPSGLTLRTPVTIFGNECVVK